MVKVLNDYSEPVIPPGFQRALQLIDPKLSLLWHQKAQRWLIVTKDIPMKIFKDGYVVEYVVSVKGQYAPLDEDVLRFLRKSRWERDDQVRKYDPLGLDNHLQSVDKDRQEKADAGMKQRLDGFQEFNKKAHKLDTVKTFI